MGKCGDEGAAARREGENMEVGFSQFTWEVDATAVDQRSDWPAADAVGCRNKFSPPPLPAMRPVPKFHVFLAVLF